MQATHSVSTTMNNPEYDPYTINQIDSSGLPTGNNTHLSVTTLKSLKVGEWASINRDCPSLKLDLLTAVIDVEDEAIIKALLICVQAKGAVQ